MKWKTFFCVALAVLAGFLTLPAMAEGVNLNLEPALYTADTNDPGSITDSYTVTGVAVELLSGTFGVTDESQLLFVAVSPDGAVQLYCAVSDTEIGGLPGEVVRLSDSTLSFVASDCVTGDAWRTRHRQQGS